MKDMIAVSRLRRVHVDEARVGLAVATHTACFPKILEKVQKVVVCSNGDYAERDDRKS